MPFRSNQLQAARSATGATLRIAAASACRLLTGPRIHRHALAATLLVILFPLAAQSPGTFRASPAGQVSREDSDTPLDIHMEAKRITQLNKIRQKAIVEDSGKLLRLAQELNDDASAGGTILSPAERMRKAAEIEKLARGVRDKMTYAIGAPPDPATPFSAY